MEVGERTRPDEWSRRLLHGVPGVALLAVDRDGVVRAAGGGLAEGGEALVGRKAGDPSVSALLAPASVRRAIAGEAFVEVRQDGGRALEIHWCPDRAEDGTVRGALALGLDVTARARTEAELFESRALLDVIADASPHAIVAFDGDRRVRLWNAYADGFFRVPASQALGRRLDALPAALAAVLGDLAGRALAGEMLVNLERPWTTAEGRPIASSVTVAPLRDPAGAVSGGVIAWADITQRRTAEQALVETDRLLQSVVTAAPVGIHVIDTEGLVRLWNPACERIYGLPSEAVLGKPLPGLAPGQEPERTEILDTLRRGEPVVDRELHRVRADGTPMRIRLSSTPLRGADGGLYGAVGVFDDVTERRALEEAWARLAAIVDASVDPIVSYDPQGTLLTWNHAAERLYGWLADEAVGRNVSMLVPESRQGEALALIERVGRGERVTEFETERRRKDGVVIPVAISVSPECDAAGRVVGAATITRDIRDRKRAEAERERRAARDRVTSAVSRAMFEVGLDAQAVLDATARAVAEEVGDACVVRLATGGVLAAAAAHHRDPGRREALARVASTPGPMREGILAQVFRSGEPLLLSHTTPQEWEALTSGIFTAYAREAGVHSAVVVPIRAGEDCIGTTTIVREGGSPALDEQDLALLADLADRMGFAVAHARLYRDARAAQSIAERARSGLKRLNRELDLRVEERTHELEAMLEELDAFTYAVSHDLRQPLRGIDGFTAMVLEDARDRLHSRDIENLERVRAAVRRMSRLIDDLLVVTRVARPRLSWEDADLSGMVEGIAASLKATEPGRDVTFDVQPGVRAQGDPALLEIALEALLDNAWKFTRPHRTGHVAFAAHESEEGTVYAVRDDGIGFDMAFVDQLFRPLRQLHAPGEADGAGIGLATVRRIIRRHGGRVWAESEPDRGATFSFTLGPPPQRR